MLEASAALGVACPGSGSKLVVKVNNPTLTTIMGVTISGQSFANFTCTTQAFSYSQGVTLNPGMNSFTVPASAGLNSGMWVHRINVPATGQDQYQQGVVLYTTATADYPVANWTYFPHVVTVSTAGDASGGPCGATCTFRQALTSANGIVGGGTASAPILIQFTASPGTMTSSSVLQVGSSTHGYITIDGTDSAGDPWIVGDPLAAAKGSQDAFPRAINLAGITRLDVRGTNVTLKGLAIEDTTAGTPSGKLVESNNANLAIEAVRLKGGARTLASCVTPACGGEWLLYSNSGGVRIVNSEGQAAYGPAVELSTAGASDHEITDGWFHHNYFNQALRLVRTTMQRNVVELTGFRVDDNAQVNNVATGVETSGAFPVTLKRNLVRNNTGLGVDVQTISGGYTLTGDYLCGNGDEGTRAGGVSGTLAADGMAATYNAGFGIEMLSSITGGSLSFTNSAFTSNVACGFRNSAGVTAVANGNQWRGVSTGSCLSSVDYCAGSPILCGSSQSAVNALITLDTHNPAGGTTPVVPSNVLQVGQSVRVQGVGFNAIDGNPLAGGVCTDGAGGITTDNCCRKADKANLCGSGQPPAPISGLGNCVAFSDRLGAWTAAAVTAVTPTTITTEIPTTLLACLGSSGELVRVTKQGTGGPIADTASYCTNRASKQG